MLETVLKEILELTHLMKVKQELDETIDHKTYLEKSERLNQLAYMYPRAFELLSK